MDDSYEEIIEIKKLKRTPRFYILQEATKETMEKYDQKWAKYINFR